VREAELLRAAGVVGEEPEEAVAVGVLLPALALAEREPAAPVAVDGAVHALVPLDLPLGGGRAPPEAVGEAHLVKALGDLGRARGQQHDDDDGQRQQRTARHEPAATSWARAFPGGWGAFSSLRF